jgi:hypothetical protein
MRKNFILKTYNMIHGTILKNGTLRLILTGTDSVEDDCLKQLDGATVNFVSDNLKLLDKNLAGALVLEVLPKAKKDESTDTKRLGADTQTGDK